MLSLLQDKIRAAIFLDEEQKQYFLSRVATLTEEGMMAIDAYMDQANKKYAEESARIDAQYREEFKKVSREVDQNFSIAKKMIEESVKGEDAKEGDSLLAQI